MKKNRIKKVTLKDIGIFSIGRKNSFRVKKKLLKKFSNTTLTDIILKKLKVFNNQSFFAAYEKEFEIRCRKHKIRFVERSYKSANINEPISLILNFLKNEKYKKFIIINACVPFLKVRTIKRFIKFCLQKPNLPAFSVIRKNNFFLNNKKQPVNFKVNLKTINTKRTNELYEFAHSLYFFDKNFFLKNGRYWNYKDLRYFEIDDKLEQIDIDTNQDFELAKQLWNTTNAK